MKTPSYQKVLLKITEQIQSGSLLPGERLKSEKDLAAEFGVGRSTLRESLRLLQEAGYIEIKNGVGSFVKAPASYINNNLSRLDSVGKMIESAGFCSGTRCHTVEHILPEKRWRELLALTEQEKVVVILRERSADARAVACSWTVFPEKLVGDSLDDGIYGRIFDKLEQQCSLIVRYAQTEISALNQVFPRDRMAQKILSGPILLLQQLHFDCNDVPVFLSLDYIRTDEMQLTLRRERV